MKNLQTLNHQGRLVMVGVLGGTKCEVDILPILFKRLQIKGLVMRSRSIEDKRSITQKFQEQCLPDLICGNLKPVIDSVFQLADVQQAHLHMLANKNIGKIILKID